MSTRSSIALKKSDGTFEAIYCHYDGYPEGGVGEMLFRNYDDPDIIECLLSLGDLSNLGSKPIPYWDDTHTDSDWCETYSARGETDVDSREFKTADEVIDFYDGCDYHYFFIDGEWYYCEGSDNNLMPLRDLFA